METLLAVWLMYITVVGFAVTGVAAVLLFILVLCGVK